ncbi:MAG: DNA repair protein RadC [Deltaproteobacteria bacterium]|nr:DNA repair protein RadC [Candidatus Anaeroferrophillus wilburensis]MBN2889247.1 DNA repair protein RadC [Deltaproteobacteria bacterium]
MPDGSYRQWTAGHRRRLKKRFVQHGLHGFADYEVIELLLTYALPRRDVKPLAKELLQRFGSLKGVLDAPAEKLMAVVGISDHTAVLITLSRALLSRYLLQEVKKGEAITSPLQAGELCRSYLEGQPDEYFFAVFLDNQHHVLEAEIIHHGTVSMSAVYPRSVMERALYHKAAAVIVAHNHPGGSTTPSADDLAVTRELQQAARVLGLRLLDHLIVAGSTVISLQELGHV